MNREWAGHERNCIMPNPKRRHSTRRTALRRSHDFLTAVGLSECPSCHEKKLPHRACPKCGVSSHPDTNPQDRERKDRAHDDESKQIVHLPPPFNRLKSSAVFIRIQLAFT